MKSTKATWAKATWATPGVEARFIPRAPWPAPKASGAMRPRPPTMSPPMTGRRFAGTPIALQPRSSAATPAISATLAAAARTERMMT